MERAHSNQRRFGYTRSLKYHLVVMLGARIDVIQPQIRNLIVYLLPLPDKKMTTTVVKRDKTSVLDWNDHQTWSRLQRTLFFFIRKGSIKYCILLLWARLKISYGMGRRMLWTTNSGAFYWWNFECTEIPWRDPETHCCAIHPRPSPHVAEW